MPPKATTRVGPSRSAKAGSKTPRNYNTASIPPKADKMAQSPSCADPTEAAKTGPSSIAAAVAQGKNTYMLETPSAGPASSAVSPSKAGSKATKKAKGKGKAVDSDEDADGEEEDEDEIRVQTRDRTVSARQNMLQKDPKVFIKEQKRKAKQDLLDAAAANDPVSSGDEIQEAPAKAAKKPTTAKPKPTAKKAAPKKSAPKKPAARSKTTNAQTIQNGSITKAAQADPEKPKRRHRSRDYGYETAPETSEKEKGKNETCAKLRETIDRHARWCPFVRVNKKVHSLFRRVRYLESREVLESEDDDRGEEEEVHVQVISDENPNDNPEDEDHDEEDDEDGEQPAETKQTTQTATKAATKKAAPRKASAKSEVTAKTIGTSMAHAGTGDDTGVENDNDRISVAEEEDQSEREDETRPAQDSSDDELDSLHDDDEDVEEGRKLVEELTTPHEEVEATSPFPTEGAGGKKRKISEVETTIDDNGKAEGKRQRSSV